jgi:cytochrome c oxidase assembly protein subunit 15
MKGGVFYEHGHRMVASTVGLMTIVMAVWLWRADPRPWMKRLGWAALGGVVFQGLLGGLTVIYLLPKPVSIGHACLAELFFSTTCAIALFTSREWHRGPVPVASAGWPVRPGSVVLLPLAVLCQVALGAAYRHKVLDLIPHVLGALAVMALVMYSAILILVNHRDHPPLRRTATALLSITFLQVFLGVAAYMSRVSTADAPQPMPVMVVLTVAHVALGALTMAASVIAAIQVHRHVRPPLVEAPAGATFAR